MFVPIVTLNVIVDLLKIHISSFVSIGDVEGGEKIYKGNATNSSNAQTPANAKPEEGEEAEAAAPAAATQSGRKEKSVLQAKLTKLAIQIGYAGKTHHIIDMICRQNSLFRQDMPVKLIIQTG